MNKSLKILALVFAVMFLGFAAVQFNDPDRSLWIFIYLVASAISFSAYKGSFDKVLIITVMLVSVFGAFEFFPYGHFEGVALKHGMKTIEIETARESLGFAIVAASSLLFLFMSFRKAN